MRGDRILELRQRPAYGWCVAALLVATVGVLVALIVGQSQRYGYGSPGTTDFIEYWTAGQLMRSGENPYDFDRLHAIQIRQGSKYPWPIVMWNPPWLLVWIYPLLLCPFLSASGIWFAVSFFIIMASITLVWRTLCRHEPGVPIGAAWAAGAAFVPALITLHMGQMSSVLLLGVAGFLYFASRDRDYVAGIFLALTTVKPHVAYLLWLAVAWSVISEKRWKCVAGAATLLLPSIGALTLIYPDWFVQYRSAAADPPLHWQTPTLGGVLRLLAFANAPSVQFLPTLLVSGLFMAYLAMARPTFHWRTAVAPLLLGSMCTAPYGWSFDHTILLIPYLETVYWLLTDRLAALSLKRAVWTGLPLFGLAILSLNRMHAPEMCYVWVPWVVAAFYAVARLKSQAASYGGAVYG